MTFEDFQIDLRKKTNPDRYWYLFLCGLVISFGIVFVFCARTKTEGKYHGKASLFYTASCFCFLMSGYVLYKLPNRYKIINVDSNLQLDTKRSIIEQLLHNYNSENLTKEKQYLYFRMEKGLWKNPYYVHLFFDNSRFAFCVQSYSDRGFIDFGETEKVRQELADFIELLSTDQPQSLANT